MDRTGGHSRPARPLVELIREQSRKTDRVGDNAGGLLHGIGCRGDGVPIHSVEFKL